MKAMRKALAAVAALAILVGCQPVTNSSTNNNNSNNNGNNSSPKKLSIELPSSLTPASKPAASSSSSGRAAGSGYTSAGYNTLYSAVDMMKSLTPMVAQFGIMSSALISQNNLSPSSETKTGVKVNVTSEMLGQINDSLPPELAGDGKQLPPVGDFTMPDFVYDTSENSNFDYKLVITMPSTPVEGSDPIAGGSQTVYWSNDWSKFAMVVDMSGMKLTFANDVESKSTSMKIESTSFDYELKFKADAESEAHGVFVSVKSTMHIGETTFTSEGTGYGDDNGGGIRFAMSGFGGSVLYAENFDTAGEVTYQAILNIDDDHVSSVNFGEENKDYSGKLVNTDFGAAPDFFTVA